MSIAAIVFKHSAPGLRVFENDGAAIQAGENPAVLHHVAGALVKWPPSLGAPPTESDVAAWESERVAAVDLEAKRRAAEAALREAQFNAALNDPNAPQAVKDYKAAKDK